MTDELRYTLAKQAWNAVVMNERRAAESTIAGLLERVSAYDRELAALSSDKQTLMTAVTYWMARADTAETENAALRARLTEMEVEAARLRSSGTNLAMMAAKAMDENPLTASVLAEERGLDLSKIPRVATTAVDYAEVALLRERLAGTEHNMTLYADERNEYREQVEGLRALALKLKEARTATFGLENRHFHMSAFMDVVREIEALAPAATRPVPAISQTDCPHQWSKRWPMACVRCGACAACYQIQAEEGLGWKCGDHLAPAAPGDGALPPDTLTNGGK